MFFLTKLGGTSRKTNFIEGGVKSKSDSSNEPLKASKTLSIPVKKVGLHHLLFIMGACATLICAKLMLFSSNNFNGYMTLELTPSPVVKQRSLLGTIEAKHQSTILAPFDGQIVESNVSIGQRVSKGDVLVKINTREVQTKLNQAEVVLIQAQEKFDNVKNWQNSLEMSQQRRELKKASASVEKATHRTEQAQKLFDLGIISKNEYDTERDSLSNARDQYTSAKEQHQSTLKKGNAMQIEIAQRELENATYNAGNMRKVISAGTIIAPINGVILPARNDNNSFDDEAGTHLVSESDIVKKGTKLFLIATTDELQTKTKIDEFDMRFLEVGQTVEISSDSVPDLLAVGRIVSIAHQGYKDFDQPNIPLFDMTISLDDVPLEQRQSLRLGGNVNIAVETYKNDEAIVVPFSAVHVHGGQKTVQAAMENGDMVKRVIEIGASLTDGVEVLSGVNAGDVVLVPKFERR